MAARALLSSWNVWRLGIGSCGDVIGFWELPKVICLFSPQQFLTTHEMRLEGMPKGLRLAGLQPVDNYISKTREKSQTLYEGRLSLVL